MTDEYIAGLVRRYVEEKRIVWYLKDDGRFIAKYKAGDDELWLLLSRNHRNLVELKIELKPIMEMAICQPDRFILPNSPAGKLLKKITHEAERASPDRKLFDDLESIYMLAAKSPIKYVDSREILKRIISGF